ncbi:MAG: DUF3883 domain-containing protein [Nitrospirae bacterium]|jgi:hypothetical protein|nr:DUF3883 domain-containing protein [Nitrospirota bacterium]
MSIVSEHLQNLLAQIKTPLWGGYVNMLKTLESVFPSPKHWILEFLQNAEDATKDADRADVKRFSIHLQQDSLWILNNGKVFDNHDFYAICDVNSFKLPSLGFRGYIGIGFKSIFHITNRIDIHSGDYHFKFDKQHWEDSKRQGVPLSKWPWEILPIENHPVDLPEGYTTGFYVPMASAKGQEILQKIKEFLIGPDFPKEAILQLEYVKAIEIQTTSLSFTITKEIESSESLPVGKKEVIILKKQIVGQRYSEEDWYLVFRKVIPIPEEIKKDEETERVRRSEIPKREIGVVFKLDNTKNIQPLYGKLAGVYSFLPIEGEQTGLPFGIFGDFIPLPGRELISYSAKWNHWISDKIFEFFKEIIKEIFLYHEQWESFPARLLQDLPFGSLSGESAKFWNSRLRDPIKTFLETESCYFDRHGNRRKLEELTIVDEDIEQIFGEEDLNMLEEITNKKIVKHSIKDHLWSRVSEGDRIKKYNIFGKKKILDNLKNKPQKLAKIYILPKDFAPKDRPLSNNLFVLAEDRELYTADQVINIAISLDQIPNLLKQVIPEDKKLLHPEIARNRDAVESLKSCGLKEINKQTVVKELVEKINTFKGSHDELEFALNDIIQATLLIINEGGDYIINRLIAQDGTFIETKHLFVPRAPLDWLPLWKAYLLPGYQPVHKNYLVEQNMDRISEYFEKWGVHGFNKEKDRSLIETTAYAIFEERLRESEHRDSVSRVTQHDKLGYDYECKGHCEKVFEVKGMSEPEDVPLGPNHWKAVQDKDYVLICVYNLPNQPDKVRYKEITKVKDICDPVERATVPKNKWLAHKG